MQLGILEGDTLATGVPRMRLQASEQPALGALRKSDLVRAARRARAFLPRSSRRLGAPARARGRAILRFDGKRRPGRSAAMAPRRAPVRSAAARAVGRRRRTVAAGHCGPRTRRPNGSVIRDLFLESLFLASNAAELLERTWPALCANGGRLLNRLLNRFLFVATLPDPRVAALHRSRR